MRIAGVIAVTALVAACSQSVGGDAEPSSSPQAAPPSATTTTTAQAAPSATRPPGEGAPIDEVIAWVEAGPATDPGGYHEAYLDGVTTRLGDEIAFTAASGAPNSTTQCITDAQYNSGGLTCLLELDSPAPRPAGEGVWKAGWVDYAGASMQVGSFHGDPGPFVKGSGPQLGEGQSLAFGDYRCRSDAADGLLCVNFAHRSAVRISAAGVLPFGCLQPVTPPPPDAGAMFSC